MTKKATVEEAVVHTDALLSDAPLTRDELRKALLGTAPKAESKIIKMFGVDLEIRQPSLGSIMAAREENDQAIRAVDMIIEYAYVPGTDDHVFEMTDRDVIKNWPFGKDLTRLNAAIAELTGVDVDAVVEGLRDDPLDG